MKYIVIGYINSEKNISCIEGIMDYHRFSVIESNDHYRVFTGHFGGNAGKFAEKLKTEFETLDLDIEDSLFFTYPVTLATGHLSLSNYIIKRKGNKFLRRS